MANTAMQHWTCTCAVCRLAREDRVETGHKADLREARREQYRYECECGHGSDYFGSRVSAERDHDEHVTQWTSGEPLVTSQAQHTPGPWFTVEVGGVWIVTHTQPDQGRTATKVARICYEGTIPFSWGQRETHRSEIKEWCLARDKANARLIAAAPELLEALREVMAVGGISYQRRITGQNEAWCALVDRARAAIRKATEP